jgi:hypothetical protein
MTDYTPDYTGREGGPSQQVGDLDQNADWEYHGKVSFWTPDEAVCLLHGFEPIDLDCLQPHSNHTVTSTHELFFVGDSFYKKVMKTRELVHRAIISGELTVLPRPLDFVMWAYDKGLDMPEEMLGLLDQWLEESEEDKEPLDPDSYIRNLKLFPVNDSEFKIQAPGQNPVTCNYSTLGCRTERDKNWRILQEFLGNPNHTTYCKGDTQRKRLVRSTNKLCEFLRKQFQVSIPKGFRLYEQCPDEAPEIFRLKSQIRSERPEKSGAWALSNEELKNTIFRLSNDITTKQETQGPKVVQEMILKLTEYFGVAVKKGLFPKDALPDFLPEDLPDDYIRVEQRFDKEESRDREL